MNLFPRPSGSDRPEEPFSPDLSEGAETGLYLALLELIDEGLIITSDERILEVNSAACRLLERDYRELTGQSLEILFSSENAFLAARARLFIQGQMRGSLQVALPGGRSQHLRFVAAARIRPGIHAIILSRDLLAELPPDSGGNDALWPGLAAVMDQPLMVLDARGRFAAVNLPAQRLLGAASAEVVGRPADAFVTFEAPEDEGKRLPLTTVHDGQRRIARQLLGPKPGWRVLVLPGNTPLPPPAEATRFRKIFAASPLPTLVCHPLSQRILDANPAAEAVYGYDRDTLLGLTVPVLWAEPEAHPADALSEGGIWKLRRRDGECFETEVLIFPLEHGATPGPLVLVHDLPGTPLLSSHLRLPLSVFEHSPQAILVCDGEARVLSVNRAFCTITGYRPEEVLGCDPKRLASGRHDAAFYTAMWQELAEHDRWQGEIWNRRKDGEVYPEWLSIAAIRNGSGQALHYVGVFNDLSAKQQAEARAAYLATHDSLTGLPNMRALERAFAEAQDGARRRRRNIGLIKVDLDAFKEVNRHYGNALGDRLLQEVARRLRSALPAHCLVARKRSDAFLVMVPDADLLSQVSAVAEALVAAFDKPFAVDEASIPLTASVGAALFPEDGSELAQLVRNASTATRAARHPDKSVFRFFASDFDAGDTETRLLAATLPHALAKGELQLYYQPIQDTASGRIAGAEALLRWQHPDLGLLPFTRFAAAARHTGMLAELESWVLGAACSAAAAWNEGNTYRLPLSVNLSSERFLASDCLQRVQVALDASGLAAERLELDIDQGLFAAQPRSMEDICRRLTGIGVGLAVDDFGEGPANLAALAHLPMRRLKLERSLVRQACQGEDSSIVVEMAVAMARTLGVEVVAKGVESEAQSSFLKALACHLQQGIVFGMPRASLPGAPPRGG